MERCVPIACRIKCRLPSVATRPFAAWPLSALQHHSLNQPCSYFTSVPLHVPFPLPGMPLCYLCRAKIPFILKLQTQVPPLPWCLQAELVVLLCASVLFLHPSTHHHSIMTYVCLSYQTVSSKAGCLTIPVCIPSIVHSSQPLIIGAQ